MENLQNRERLLVVSGSFPFSFLWTVCLFTPLVSLQPSLGFSGISLYVLDNGSVQWYQIKCLPMCIAEIRAYFSVLWILDLVCFFLSTYISFPYVIAFPLKFTSYSLLMQVPFLHRWVPYKPGIKDLSSNKCFELW